MRAPVGFAAAVRALDAVAHRFDDASHAAKHAALAALAKAGFEATPALAHCHELLLFLYAHPSDAAMTAAVEQAFERLARFMKAQRKALPQALEGEGLPWAEAVTRFSHDCLRWLLDHPAVEVRIDSWNEPRHDLNAVLALTLPSVERSETTAALANDDLLDALQVAPAERLRFLVNELARFDPQPLVKDHLFDGLECFVRLVPREARFSKAWNRLPMPAGFTPHVQRTLLKKFDPRAVMDAPLPAPRTLDAAGRTAVLDVVKNSLALTVRETDPGTYADPRALFVLDLEHGLTVALYGMVPARQLPCESYVGFTLFKNGLAAAYGGSWVLGPRATFGMNIFEPYRGGESGFMMCQVLRAYRHTFGVRFFEVDAHQFGLDNPDGIATGAFWFYDRHGFRSLDAALAARADRERAKIAKGATSGVPYRSSEATLIAFTGANVALNFGGPVPTHLFDLLTPVTRWVQQRHGGNRAEAEADALGRFHAATGFTAETDDERRVLVEWALVAAARGVAGRERCALLARMVRAKPHDLLEYQRLLTAFLAAGAQAGG